MAEIGDELGAYDTLVLSQPAEKQAVWEARDSFLTVIESESKLVDEMDVVVPVDRIPAFLRYAHDVGAENGVRMRSFGHAGDGNLHIYCCANDMKHEEFIERSRRVMRACYTKCVEFNGQISGEHGIGYGKKEYLREAMGDTAIELMAGIKRVFDPTGILNPGKVCD